MLTTTITPSGGFCKGVQKMFTNMPFRTPPRPPRIAVLSDHSAPAKGRRNHRAVSPGPACPAPAPDIGKREPRRTGSDGEKEGMRDGSQILFQGVQCGLRDMDRDRGEVQHKRNISFCTEAGDIPQVTDTLAVDICICVKGWD